MSKYSITIYHTLPVSRATYKLSDDVSFSGRDLVSQ